MITVHIVDYGVGNIQSIAGALETVGAKAIKIADPYEIAKAQYIVLPGVGAFNSAMLELKARRLDVAIRQAQKTNSAKILGICLGFQLLGKSSEEHGLSEGLGLLSFKVKKIQSSDNAYLKVPHVGFNSVTFSENKSFFSGVMLKSDFYFTHSYWVGADAGTHFERVGTCFYGGPFLAAFQTGNIYGTQFHPEKSQNNGLRLLKNFIE